MIINSFILVLLYFTTYVFSVPNLMFESCTTLDKKIGACILINDCPSAYSLLARPVPEGNMKLLQELHCGFEKLRPKVCCDINEVDETHDPVPVPNILPIETNDLLPSTNDCGVFIEERWDVATLDGYPWMAILEYESKNKKTFQCGGALISNRYVLTAAHCVSPGDLEEGQKPVGVRLGEFDVETNPDCEYLLATDCCCTDLVLNVGIEQIIVHPDYKPSDAKKHSDIALVRLNKNVKYTGFIRPVCLQPHSLYANKSDPGRSTVVGGWGFTKNGHKQTKKYFTKLDLESPRECSSKIRTQLRDDQLCALPREGKDSCIGDSGGILMNDNRDIQSLYYVALGVMSYAYPNCSENSPIVYTRVESYLPWIKQNLKP